MEKPLSYLQNMTGVSLHVGMTRQTDTAPIVPSIMAAVAMTRITLVLMNRGVVFDMAIAYQVPGKHTSPP